MKEDINSFLKKNEKAFIIENVIFSLRKQKKKQQQQQQHLLLSSPLCTTPSQP